jgi:hypothetical protein
MEATDIKTVQPPSGAESERVAAAQLADVALMLDYCAKRGVEVPKEILHDLTNSTIQQARKDATDEQVVSFHASFAKLSKLILPATIDSIKFGARGVSGESQADRAAKGYSRWSWALFITLIIVQIYYFVLTSFIEDLHKVQKQFAVYYDKYQSIFLPLKNEAGLKIATEGLNDRASDALYKQVAITTQAKFENFLAPPEGYVVVKSPSGDSMSDSEKPSTTVKEVDRVLTSREYDDLKRFQRVDLDGIYALLPFANKSSEDEEFVKFNEYQSDTRNVKIAQLLAQALNRFVLPLLYGVVGAAIFVHRSIAEELSSFSYSIASRTNFWLRLPLGAVAGLAVTWLIPSGGETSPVSPPLQALSSLSPLVLSFVAGYSVELLFSILDRIVSSFRTTGPEGR